jgi:hypothetical protein
MSSRFSGVGRNLGVGKGARDHISITISPASRFSRHPVDHPIDKRDIRGARMFMSFVFDDATKTPRDRVKKGALRQLDSKVLIALAVLIRAWGILAFSVSTTRALCIEAPSLVSTTCWYNNVDLWKASLGVISSSAVYLRFRRGTV